MANKNKDESKFKRVGLYDSNNLTVEYFDKDTEETIVYSILEPLKNPFFHDKEVEIDISIKITGSKGRVTEDGELID